MLRLMQKNAGYFLFYALAWLPIFILAVVIPGRPLDAGMVYFDGMWIILLLLGALIVCEQNENKTKGYDFLRTLPVKDSQIVKAKFFLAFLTACLVLVYLNIIYLFVSKPPDVLAIAKIFIPLCAFVGLLLDGFLYVLIYRLGLSKTLKIGWIMFFGIVLMTVLLIELVLVRSGIDAGKIASFINSIPPVIWLLLGLGALAGFYGIMALAIQTKQKSRG